MNSKTKIKAVILNREEITDAVMCVGAIEGDVLLTVERDNLPIVEMRIGKEDARKIWWDMVDLLRYK